MGYSLFKMIDINTKISAGSKKLREWMLFPLRDYKTLQYRLDHIEWLIYNKDNGIFQRIEEQLANIRDLRQLSLRISSFRSKYSDWCAMYESLAAINALCELARTHQSNVSINDTDSNYSRESMQSV